MPKRISIAKHLTIEQKQQYYRQAKDGVESRQYQIIWLLAPGKKTLEVEEITGYSRTWIYALVKRYNELGVAGYSDSEALLRSADRRNQNQGTKPLIDDVEQAQLWQALQGNAPDRGVWNGRKVADWLTSVTGRLRQNIQKLRFN